MGPPQPVRSTSRFLNLPPELRNLIYELCIDDAAAGSPHELNTLALDYFLLRPATLSVCHQLRQECLPIFRNAVQDVWAEHTVQAIFPAYEYRYYLQEQLERLTELPILTVRTMDMYWEDLSFGGEDEYDGYAVIVRAHLKDGGKVRWSGHLHREGSYDGHPIEANPGRFSDALRAGLQRSAKAEGLAVATRGGRGLHMLNCLRILKHWIDGLGHGVDGAVLLMAGT